MQESKWAKVGLTKVVYSGTLLMTTPPTTISARATLSALLYFELRGFNWKESFQMVSSMGDELMCQFRVYIHSPWSKAKKMPMATHHLKDFF